MALITASNLINITPEINALTENSSYAVGIFKYYLYLAIIYYDPEKRQDLRRVLCYNFLDKTWETLYRESLTNESQLNFISSKIRVFNDNIYILLESPLGWQTLRSEFRENSREKVKLVATTLSPEILNLFSYRQWLSFEDNLYFLDEKGNLINSDLTANLSEFDNEIISEIAVFKNYLYGATVNLERGFQIWKKGNQAPLEPVITNGAYRYTLNEKVFSLVDFQDCLYFVTGVREVGEYSKKTWGIFSTPNDFEIIRLYPDNDWDIIAGTPRFTPQGLKVPLSGMGPGLDDLSHPQFQFLKAHNNALFLGIKTAEGLQLWVTENGIDWMTIPEYEFSNFYQVEVDSVFSIVWGLILVLKVTDLSGVKTLQIYQIK